MKFSRNLLFIALFIFPYICFSQSERPKPNWQNLDLEQDGVPGMSTEKAYNELLVNKESTTTIVAVIDGGVDVHHEDLKAKVWENEGEMVNDSTDNDENGYIDDKYGWNFIGNKNGENVEYDNLEVLRLVRELHPKYVSVLPTTPLTEEERRDFLAYQKMNTDYMSRLQIAQLTERAIKAFKLHVDSIVKHIDKDTITITDIKAYKATNKDEGRALSMVNKSLRDKSDFNSFYEELVAGVKYYENQVNYHLNMDYDSRSIVGDTYSDSEEQFYGNADVIGPDAKHGTHVAGIIAADRNNGIGIKGVADDVNVMVLRVVPNGDERDKDVANAITYAVDMGAKIINMSFGKAYVKDKQVVDKAVKYAMEQDVLLVHAAGNEGKDNDVSPNYPNKNYVDSLGINMGIASAWIEVGATGWKYDAYLVADFSNYGKRSVDVFAPGVDISSTIPHSKYKEEQGTSMAAPMVSGLAALIRSYYPNFKASEVKKIILDSVVKPTHSVRVMQNGSKRKVALSDISVTGGIVNVYNALVLAEKLSD
ncbi:S8 family serine peptidase [Olivibacter sp. SDN3]|uniref:S8 family serine peptidase n=1 Tax=Olivibacter sp. SDN3 TaxID=2764720 RepID=UPI0016519529|nr:S8 family serine peptidase [Olivibacter sp. SDN3]QNL50536.1 S8 family serine peptidase [Olivibacter sp. SDN3]